MANLPAEIAHLLEEIQAKDRVVQECRSVVNTRDNSIQKFLKTNGCAQPNPKEEAYVKICMTNFDKARVIQEEKIALSEKAATLLDRQIRRLDLKIRDLQNEGAISIDPQLPSLLNNNTHRLPSLSSSATGAPTPLHPLSGNAGPSTTIANNPLTRLVQPSASTNRHASPAKASQPPVTTNGTASAASSLNPARSSSSDPSKRRRLNNGHLSVPPASSSLRQSSLGPGTPKPQAAQAARGSSVGPRPTTKKPPRTAPPHQRIGHLNPTKKPSNSQARRRLHAANRKSGLSTNVKASPSISSTGGDSASVSELDGGEAEDVASDAEMGDAEIGDEDPDGEGDDTRKYCTCRSVSYGNMVACDNDDCPYEWFHWNCVGMTREPAGKWYCSECRQRLGIEKQ